MMTSIHKGSSYIRRCSSYRVKPPHTTLATAKKVSADLGITRVSDITCLDFLQLPVYSSIRPTSLTLCVNAGKGIKKIDAEIGAYMEAIEYAVAEPDSNCSSELIPIKVKNLVEQFDKSFRFVDFAPVIGTEFSLNTEILCSQVKDISSEYKTYYIPANLIFLPLNEEGYPNIFGGTTNGLASGNSIEEATLHALLEVMERDAVTMSRFHQNYSRVENSTLPDQYTSLLNEWETKGVELIVLRIENEFDLPCFQAFISESRSLGVRICSGSGLHIEKEIAINRAICEAAQSRLSHIHGGRDDIVNYYSKRDHIDEEGKVSLERETLSKLRNTNSVSYRGIHENDVSQLRIEQLIEYIVQKIVDATKCSVFRYEFQNKYLEGLSVVKVIAPGLEHIEHNSKRFGRRALEALLYG